MRSRDQVADVFIIDNLVLACGINMYIYIYQCILSRRWSQFPRKFGPTPMSNLVSPEEQNTNSCLHDSSWFYMYNGHTQNFSTSRLGSQCPPLCLRRWVRWVLKRRSKLPCCQMLWITQETLEEIHQDVLEETYETHGNTKLTRLKHHLTPACPHELPSPQGASAELPPTGNICDIWLTWWLVPHSASYWQVPHQKPRIEGRQEHHNGLQTSSNIFKHFHISHHMGLSENSVPLNPMVLLIIIPIKWLFHWEYTLFSDKYGPHLMFYPWPTAGTPHLDLLPSKAHVRQAPHVEAPEKVRNLEPRRRRRLECFPPIAVLPVVQRKLNHLTCPIIYIYIVYYI